MAREAEPEIHLSANEINNRLNALNRDVPWTHHFDFGGIETISREDNEQFYGKSCGLKKVSNLVLHLAQSHLKNRDLSGLRVLDIASAEGGHSIDFARAGAGEVLGIEGRQLYVDRASFAAEAFGLKNVRFLQGDVRSIDPEETGSFDLVVASGILHHLGPESFVDFINTLGALTHDTLILYTHVANAASEERFKLRPGPIVEGKFEGCLFREHKDKATPEQRLNKVRASLDQTFSFWAREGSLILALKEAGFAMIYKVLVDPYLFGNWSEGSYRVVLVAQK